MNQEVLDNIVKYINSSFIDGNERVQISNLSSFVKYLDDINTDEIDYDSIVYIINKAPKINNLLIMIIDSLDRDIFMKHPFISSLVYAFASENKIDFDIDFNESVKKVEGEAPAYEDYGDVTENRKRDLDLIKLYKRDIGPIEKYTKEEEIEVFKRYKKAKGIAKESIRNEIMLHNLKHVFVMAVDKHIGKVLPLGDLIQEGNIGLIKAIEKFNLDKGIRFSTYSRYWINQAMNVAIAEQSGNIKFYYRSSTDLNKIYKVINNYQMLYGDTPDEYYIAKEVGFSTNRVVKLLLLSDVISLDDYVKNDKGEKDSRVQDLIPAEEEDHGIFQSLAARMDFKDAILSSSYLTDNRKLILDLRFGLTNGRCETLENIGKRLNLTRQRIEVLEKKAIKDIKKDPRVNTYNPALECEMENMSLKLKA